jgi:hypothetical protein
MMVVFGFLIGLQFKQQLIVEVMKDWDLSSEVNNILGMDQYKQGRSLPFNDVIVLDADLDNPMDN